jgi:hypothetical protein
MCFGFFSVLSFKSLQLFSQSSCFRLTRSLSLSLSLLIQATNRRRKRSACLIASAKFVLLNCDCAIKFAEETLVTVGRLFLVRFNPQIPHIAHTFFWSFQGHLFFPSVSSSNASSDASGVLSLARIATSRCPYLQMPS